MAAIFGDKQRSAAEVGEFWEGHERLRRVDLWAAGRWLTCDDNIAFVPQFLGDVRLTARWLRSRPDLSLPFPGLSPIEQHRRLRALDDGTGELFRLLQWGPTTDNVGAYWFRVEDRLVITLEFWRETHPIPEERGVVFVAELPETEFLAILDSMVAALECGQ